MKFGLPVCNVPDGAEVVGMALFKDALFVATTKGVFQLVGDVLQPIMFQMPEAPTIAERARR